MRAPNTLSRLLRIAADVLRAAVLVAAPITLLSDQVDGAIRLTVVFLVLLALRLAWIPAPMDFAVSVTLPLATAASLFAWYRDIAWLDWTMHAVTTGALAAATYLLLVRTSILQHPQGNAFREVVLQITMVGVTLGVVWEYYEWFVETFSDVRIGVGYDDTIADLAMDSLGSLAAGACVWFLAGRRADIYTAPRSE